MSIYSPPPNPNNASIDKIIFQVERLVNQIDGFTYNAEVAGGDIADRGKQTFERMKYNFQTDTMTNVDKMVDIVTSKTDNWPLNILIGAAICGGIFLIVGALYLCTKGCYKISEFRYQKKMMAVRQIEEDI